MKALDLLMRVLTPGWVVSIIYAARYRANVSPRAEVDVSKSLFLGRGTNIGAFCKVKAKKGVVRIGTSGRIASGCFLSTGKGGVTIGDNFLCGPNVVITSSNYRYGAVGVAPEKQGSTSKGISIGDNVWIGGGTVVLDGADIGDDSIVVANSLVTQKFPPRVVLQGNPAQVIFTRDRT